MSPWRKLSHFVAAPARYAAHGQALVDARGYGKGTPRSANVSESSQRCSTEHLIFELHPRGAAYTYRIFEIDAFLIGPRLPTTGEYYCEQAKAEQPRQRAHQSTSWLLRQQSRRSTARSPGFRSSHRRCNYCASVRESLRSSQYSIAPQKGGNLPCACSSNTTSPARSPMFRVSFVSRQQMSHHRPTSHSAEGGRWSVLAAQAVSE